MDALDAYIPEPARDQVIRAVEFLFSFTLAAGVVVEDSADRAVRARGSQRLLWNSGLVD